MSIKTGGKVYLPVRLLATELAAGTAFEIVSPVDGYVDTLRLIVQTAIVTGGAVTVEVNTVAVAGVSIAVADAATKGTVYADTSTAGSSTRRVVKGDRITVTPAAAFNGGGALDGFIEVSEADTSPALPAA